MIKQIKVTKQEIRTYTFENDIRTYNYDEVFLQSILGEKGKYYVSDKNANVTWYSLKQKVDIEDVVKEDADVDADVDVVVRLEQEDYDITDAARLEIVVNEYSYEQVVDVATSSKKITLNTLKKIDK